MPADEMRRTARTMKSSISPKRKVPWVRAGESRIYSPVGFLLTAVPKCFVGEAFRLYREVEAKRREHEAAAEARRQAELAEWKASKKLNWRTRTSRKKTNDLSRLAPRGKFLIRTARHNARREQKLIFSSQLNVKLDAAS